MKTGIIIRRYWIRDGVERPPVPYLTAVDDIYRLTGRKLSMEKIEEMLSDGLVVSTPCCNYERF